jgi:glycosyltransferase involved in cell wall biosynthesis
LKEVVVARHVTSGLDETAGPPRRRYLLIHQNFPGQFVHVAKALAARGHQVIGLGITPRPVEGVQVLHYPCPELEAPSQLPMARDFEAKLARGTACAQAMQRLAEQGFTPDLIMAHPGWGEALFCKDIWPDARLLVFSEFYYAPRGSDYDFDPEFYRDHRAGRSALRLKNTALMHALSAADAAYAPTEWQRRQVPEEYRAKVGVVHDGIDTSRVRPDPHARFSVPGKGLRFKSGDEVLTFINRNLEPYRGFHVFMRALPAILEARPQAHCVLVGGDDVSYGRKPAGGGTWREALLKEVGGRLPMERVHFVGKLPYARYLQLLQVSRCHVYLTYPFVLSWSCLEAMSAGCVVAASRTAPVEEVIEHGVNGLLFDFFDAQALAASAVAVLADPAGHAHLGHAARRTTVERFDLATRCLPELLKQVDQACGQPAA